MVVLGTDDNGLQYAGSYRPSRLACPEDQADDDNGENHDK